MLTKVLACTLATKDIPLSSLHYCSGNDIPPGWWEQDSRDDAIAIEELGSALQVVSVRSEMYPEALMNFQQFKEYVAYLLLIGRPFYLDEDKDWLIDNIINGSQK